jgi:hypothetical protein
MPSRAVPAATWSVLARLGADASVAAEFYLAGGTALALRLEHRTSEDLDLFSALDFEPDALAVRLVGAKVTAAARGTLHLVLDGVRVSFLHYPPPLLYSTDLEAGLRVADARDVGTMKLAAIAGRGRRRDFVDLYFIARRVLGLDELLADFARRFGPTFSRYHVLRSLGYFDDADGDPEPRLLAPLDWKEVKAFFAAEQKRLFEAPGAA